MTKTRAVFALMIGPVIRAHSIISASSASSMFVQAKPRILSIPEKNSVVGSLQSELSLSSLCSINGPGAQLYSERENFSLCNIVISIFLCKFLFVLLFSRPSCNFERISPDIDE